VSGVTENDGFRGIDERLAVAPTTYRAMLTIGGACGGRP